MMSAPKRPFDTYGLVVKDDPLARRKADELATWLHQHGKRVVRPVNENRDYSHPPLPYGEAPDGLGCTFVLGGDGTFLSAVRWIGERAIPLIGVKFGEVGFLAETTEADLFHVAERIIHQSYSTHERMRLEVTIERQGKPVAREMVFNDVVVNKAAVARLSDIRTFIDGSYLTTYRADGLIVSTPTGSTAYSLAAGGPIVHPDLHGIVLTPICPFTLTVRPLIVPDKVEVSMELTETATDMMLTVDGQVGIEVESGDRIIIRQSPHPVHMVAVPGQTYYDLLKTKLHWSGGRV